MDVYVASTSYVTSLVLIFILSGCFVFKILLPLVPYVLLWEMGRSRRILGRRTAISTAERVVACRVGRGVTTPSLNWYQSKVSSIRLGRSLE